eukprot:gene12800-biopygen36952
MSPIYRLWGAARLQDMLPWQERWIARGQRGFRPGMATDVVHYELALRVEEALLHGEPFGGTTYDAVKCFDRLPQQILLTLVEKLGLDPR